MPCRPLPRLSHKLACPQNAQAAGGYLMNIASPNESMR